MKQPGFYFFLSVFLFIGGIRSGFPVDKVTPTNVFDYSLQIALDLQKSYPQAAEVFFLEGNVYNRASKYDRAIEAFKKGLALKPQQPDIIQLVAFLYNKTNQFEAAAEWYRKSLAIEPDAPKGNERLGQALVQLKRMDEARSAFEQEIQHNPQNPFSRIYLGERYFDVGRLKEAREQAETAAKLDPKLPEPYYLLSKINRKEGKTEAATKNLETFQDLKKKEQELISQEQTPRSDQEQALLTAAITHYEAGTVYYNHGNRNQAESHFLAAVSLDPKNEPARLSLARIYQEANQWPKAVSFYRELTVINPKEYRYPYQLGLILATMKQFEEAQRNMETALQMSPAAVDVKRALVRVLFMSQGDMRKAVELTESVISVEPTAEDYDLLGHAYFTLGELDKSLAALSKAIELDPDNSTYRQRYDKVNALRNK